LTATVVLGQTTQPVAPLSTDAAAALELRATETFNQSDYTTALPMLQRLATQLQTQPGQADRLAMVQEQIRVCQKNQPIQLAAVTSVGDTSLSTPAAPPVSPALAMGADRRPHPPLKPGEVLATTIKELGNFEFDAEHGSPIPADVQALNGGNVQLRGFMIPMDQAENISKFALVPSLFSCCFGQPPQIQHTIIVDCPKGKAVSYFPDEITVDGKLSVEPKKDDGFIVSIFEVEASSVKPAPK
jgi:hypothetical protein